ncbi:MAG: glycine-rich domain-containing protein, partial [Candidatus Paceibacterota bacterium]
MENNSRNSFTLIELLVVIAIIGILAGILIVSMTSATNSANDARRKADINQLVQAITIIKTQDGTLPAEPNANCKLGSIVSGENCSGIQARLTANGMTAIPKDPTTSNYYIYNRVSADDFTVKAVMSNATIYTYNSASNSYYANSASSCISGGGLTCTELTDGSYKINKYTLSGTTTGTFTWTAPVGVTQVEYLVVAGGGGGGNMGYGARSGGGGAGGFLTNFGGAKLSVTSGSNYTVIVGNGGAVDVNGSNSTFSTITAVGGGKGGAYASGTSAYP